MTKETYDVSIPLNGGEPRRTSDKSFLLCFCTMLVVLLTCVIVLLISLLLCNLGIFQKNENETIEMLGKIRSSTEVTKKFEKVKYSYASSSKAPLAISTTKSPLATISAKYVNPLLAYLEYLKSHENSTNPSKSPIENKTENNGSGLSTTNPKSKYLSSLGVIESNTTTKMQTRQYITSTTHIAYANTLNEQEVSKKGSYVTEKENYSTVTTVRITPNWTTTTTTSTPMRISTAPSTEITVDSILHKLLAKDQNICNTTECNLIAAQIISFMDDTKQPCENFYDFACGGIFGAKKEDLVIFSSKVLENEDNPEFLKKLNTFYRSCIKHEDRFHYQQRIERAKNLLQSLGSFYFDGQTNKTYNITEFVANLILFKAMPLFEVEIDIEPDDSTYILKLMMPDQTSINLEHWSSLAESRRKCLRETTESAEGPPPLNMTLLYTSFRNCQLNYSDFLDAIETAIIELGFFSHLSDKDLFKHIRDIRVFIEFEIFSLFEEIAPPPNLQEMVIRRQYEKIKLKQLKKDFPLIDWEKLFKIISNENITNETTIQMYNRQYFEDVFRSLSVANRGMLNNAFLAILAYSLFENTVLPSHKHSRSDYCTERTEELVPNIKNYLYKKMNPSKDVVERNHYITEIYQDLVEVFNHSLENLDWLDDKSKISIRNKLHGIHLAMFRNDDVASEMAYLEDSYKDLVLEDSNFQFNFFNLMKFKRKKIFSLQGQKATADNMFRFFVDATKDQPVFFYANDIVCIPYGLAKWATKNIPRYITMAQVGFPLAKIIGHAFDPIGMQYRVQLSDTANISYLNFAEQTRDMIVLSNPIKFGGKEYSFSLNNALSENERIAENTALRLLTDTFKTFKNESLLPWISYYFKAEQIFFLTMTQEFCRDMNFEEFMIEAYESHVLPPQFRIENMLGNSEEFLNQFNCRPGSAMTRFEDRLQFPHLIALTKEDLDYMT